MIYLIRRSAVILLTAIIILFLILMAGCNNNSKKPDNTVTLDNGNSIIYENNIRITMRDGVTLSANIFSPLAPGNYPVIMAMPPYNKDLLPYEYEAEDGDINVSEYAAFEQADPAFWVPNDYVVIAVDARGTNLSEGDLALFSANEAEDFYDAIEWAATQPWSNGNIGLNGVSYMAINQWRVAQIQPQSLKAIMPWEGFTDFTVMPYTMEAF